ncbi:OLC1v1013133C1 [Oldenlandia corymbosa var. corymbosa]|uniref:OLC1v1013133C1 n=1 Tax=Oldenlandia corymbosa var. corymbosa TaxID=529605 RepID=A0AAV1E0S1_OLDCO|nr:OLC1v1013133C1 [Oldenlandia corymbosa var. corymbosa]
MREERVELAPQESEPRFAGQVKFSGACSTGRADTRVVDPEKPPVDDSSHCSTSPLCPAPLTRQFWRAGNYDVGHSVKPSIQKGTSYLHVHPKFLHSNATSHKWAFGAIAELLDNAVDEMQNGATFVIMDRITNPKDGSSAFLIQDDGGGMDPEAIRRCLSFGFSERKSDSAIGQYGNGFKTSSMRLGSDVIVFSRCKKNRTITKSVGLLSYTFLIQTGHNQIVVPMVHYEYNDSNEWKSLHNTQQHMTNISLLLRWSPYSTEAELLKQFDDVGDHGTKIVVYNLWLTDDGKMELDFETDPQDIRISGEANKNEKNGSRMAISDEHLANRLRFSLRAYLSVLYLRVPENFFILLRGQVVEYHSIASDLKFPEVILYKPQNSGNIEGTVLTTIGFLKEAPLVNIHGFNVYYRNRLILPFWHVVSYSDSRGRGVVGVLEANFIKPTHNKQDFEKTPVFQKLEHRMKEMTWEYWDYHCHLIGYQAKKKIRAVTSNSTSDLEERPGSYEPVLLSSNGSSVHGAPFKRKENNHLVEPERFRRKVGVGAKAVLSDKEIISVAVAANESENRGADKLIQENKKLSAQCLEYEKRAEELNTKVQKFKYI